MSNSQQPTQNENVYFIDKFLVPAASVAEFGERVKYNREFIKKLPGFISDVMYEKPEANGDLSVVTVATWRNNTDLAKARESMQAEYKRLDFDPAAFFKRLEIRIDRGVYQSAD